MKDILERKKKANGDYSTYSTSATTKRTFSESSVANDDYRTPTNTKRKANDN
jgi:hypothetical protein